MNTKTSTPASSVVRTLQAAPSGLPIVVALRADSQTQQAVATLLPGAVVETVRDNPRSGFAKTRENLERITHAHDRAGMAGAPLVLTGTADALSMVVLPTDIVMDIAPSDVTVEPKRSTATRDESRRAFERNVGQFTARPAQHVAALATASELAGLDIPQSDWESILADASRRATGDGKKLIQHLAAALADGEYLGPIANGSIAVRREAARRIARRHGMKFTSAGLATAMAPHVVPGTTAGRRAPLSLGFPDRPLSFVLPLEAVTER